MSARNWFFASAVSLCLAASCATAQTATVGPKQETPQGESTTGSELSHMVQLVTQLKADLTKIHDPATRKVAEDNLDLWQHLIDKLAHENRDANSVGTEHHHADDPAPADLKQSPKPQ